MHTLLLSFRNILRNRRRTSITLTGIITGALTIQLFGGFFAAIINGAETGVVRQLGHLQIQKKGYFDFGTGSPSEYGIANYQEVLRAIQEDPQLSSMVTVATPMLAVQGIAGNFSAGVSRTVVGMGVQVRDVNQMRKWNFHGFPDSTIVPMALPEDRDDLVLIGEGLAKSLHLGQALNVPGGAIPETKSVTNGEDMPSDLQALAQAEPKSAEQHKEPRLELLAATATGVPNVTSVGVAAAENQVMKAVDDMYVALTLKRAQSLVYGRSTPSATALVVQLTSSAEVAFAKERLESLIRAKGWALEVHDFRKLDPTFEQVRGLFSQIFLFIALLMGSIVLFSVANTMTMAVMERTSEIGTLRSMGIQRGGVARLFMTEGLYIGFIGSIIGTVLALAVAFGINNAGLTWTPPGQSNRIPLVIHLLNSPNLIRGTFFGLALLAALSALLPARRAARMPIADALRHV